MNYQEENRRAATIVKDAERHLAESEKKLRKIRVSIKYHTDRIGSKTGDRYDVRYRDDLLVKEVVAELRVTEAEAALAEAIAYEQAPRPSTKKYPRVQGITWSSHCRSWHAVLKRNGKRSLGMFKHYQDAVATLRSRQIEYRLAEIHYRIQPWKRSKYGRTPTRAHGEELIQLNIEKETLERELKEHQDWLNVSFI